jgi:CBS-domain-containing membrane protein
VSPKLQSIEPGAHRERRLRQRLGLADEFLLAFLPTVTVLGVLWFVGVFSEQRVLFASLASSAFLIYLDPEHGTNQVRTLASAQVTAALLGWGAYALLGPGTIAGGAAMVLTIVAMILLDAVHPPAVSTSLSFAFRAGDQSDLVLFLLAVAMVAVLVILERYALWLLRRLRRRHSGHGAAQTG